MPELPEVEALTHFLGERMHGRVVDAVQVVALNALKTLTPSPADLVGRRVAGVGRHGKWIDVVTEAADDARADVDAAPAAVHLLVHLSRAGWVRWYESLSTTPLRPGRSPVALRLRLDDGSGMDLTEAGTRKRLAVHLVHDPEEVELVASLGVDPLSQGFTAERLAALCAARNQQVKGLLRDQRQIAGIGNAYSDEILHAARMSPFAQTRSLSTTDVERLHGVARTVLAEALRAAGGRPAAELKDAKRRGMRVHGRTGEACPVCGDTVREVSFADSALQYCPTCQTHGKPLADRRMSRLLR